MARKITLFELHFDGIDFGFGGEEPSDESDVEASDEFERVDDRTPFPVRRVFAVVGAVVLASVVRRRVAARFQDERGDQRDIEIEDVESPGAPTVD